MEFIHVKGKKEGDMFINTVRANEPKTPKPIAKPEPVEEKTEDKRGFFGKIFKKKPKKKTKEEENKYVVSAPIQMKKEKGISTDQDIVSSYNVDVDIQIMALSCYKDAFKKVGIKKKDLINDPELIKQVLQTLNSEKIFEEDSEGKELLFQN